LVGEGLCRRGPCAKETLDQVFGDVAEGLYQKVRVEEALAAPTKERPESQLPRVFGGEIYWGGQQNEVLAFLGE
jgi:hypothetical protein